MALSGDPNVSIEDKTFSCDVRAGRRHGSSTRRLADAADDELKLSGDHGAEEPEKAGQTGHTHHPPELEDE